MISTLSSACFIIWQNNSTTDIRSEFVTAVCCTFYGVVCAAWCLQMIVKHLQKGNQDHLKSHSHFKKLSNITKKCIFSDAVSFASRILFKCWKEKYEKAQGYRVHQDAKTVTTESWISIGKDCKRKDKKNVGGMISWKWKYRSFIILVLIFMTVHICHSLPI